MISLASINFANQVAQRLHKSADEQQKLADRLYAQAIDQQQLAVQLDQLAASSTDEHARCESDSALGIESRLFPRYIRYCLAKIPWRWLNSTCSLVLPRCRCHINPKNQICLTGPRYGLMLNSCRAILAMVPVISAVFWVPLQRALFQSIATGQSRVS